MNYEWVKLYFETQFEAFAKGLGRECGLREKQDRERVKAYVDEEMAALRRTIEEQSKIIEAQNLRLRSVESMFAQPGPVVDGFSRRLS